ncbi:MAG: helix-hairpin-helix domain-containing protein [Bacilli bacterium]|nr:helix-hairpin-helix domain-containing protein [Bacilli bacterium]
MTTSFKITLFFSNNIIGGDSITFQYRYRKQIIIGLIGLIIVGLSSFFILQKIPKMRKKDEVVLFKKDDIKEEKKTIEEKYLKVDIKGEVVLPGIYSLEEGSRVIDVITLAGGLTENADTSVVNLSKKTFDEMVIIIYSHEQVSNFYETKRMEKEVVDSCRQVDENALKNDACICSEEISSSKININTASKEELMELPGIGDAKAQDIIQYREEHGPFQSIEDVQNVSGIGESLYSKIQENITV